MGFSVVGLGVIGLSSLFLLVIFSVTSPHEHSSFALTQSNPSDMSRSSTLPALTESTVSKNPYTARPDSLCNSLKNLSSILLSLVIDASDIRSSAFSSEYPRAHTGTTVNQARS